jgi:hypothetical protein
MVNIFLVLVTGPLSSPSLSKGEGDNLFFIRQPTFSLASWRLPR